MKNVAVIFGGRSVEHDISILTGLHAAAHIENARVHYVYLNRENLMTTGAVLGNIDYYVMHAKPARRCWFANGYLCMGFGRKVKIDAVLNCCHGGAGENGELAAFFKLAGVPVTSCEYVSAANLQSKTRTREILSAAGFDQPKYISIKKDEGLLAALKNGNILNDIENGVLAGFPDFPLIVKPDTLGSSIGINVVRNVNELADALELVFGMDTCAVAEEFFEDITEVNCAAMRVLGEIKISECEKVDCRHEFFDYESKYLDSRGVFIKKGAEAEEQEDYNDVKELTRRAYELFEARGVVRADFILHNGKVYLNEINSVPGFLSYHLWQRAGMPYGLVLSLLIKQAITDAGASGSLQTVFSSDILIKNKGLVRL